MRLNRLSAAAVLSVATLGAGCGGSGGGTDAPAVGPPTSVSAVSGGSASVTAGSTAPIALVAKVADAGGKSVAGASVTWGTASGSISPATATTDGSGQSTAQWTPGKVAGSQSATASVSGVGAATFTATVTAGPLAKIKLTPDTTRLNTVGGTSTLSAQGLDAFDNIVTDATITYSTDNAAVATVSSVGVVTGVANGTAKITAASGGAIPATVTVIVNISSSNPCSGLTMTLAVGASQTLTGGAASQFCVNGSAGAEFVAVPFYGTGSGGTGSGQSAFTAAPSLNVTFTPLTNTTVSGPPSPSVATNTRLRAAVQSEHATQLKLDISWESRFRERFRSEFSSRMAAARASRRTISSSSSSARNSLGISAAVQAGDHIMLNVNVSSGCSTPQLVGATVQAVTAHAIVVSDDRNPSGFVQADYQSIASSFDSQVWPTDTDNFGVPYAIPVGNVTPARDPNGKITLFFTRAVNELSPKGSPSFVAGFFFGRDLLPKAPSTTNACPGSNETEMFYLLTPDPGGAVTGTFSTAFVKSITIGTVAHEFQHLINAAYRFFSPIRFSTLEETFLDEGLAHSAEELNYYASTARSPRTNLDASTAINPSDAWLAFGDQNAVRFREYLKNPDRYPPYSVLADTSLAVRGGIWSFLRYATDKRASSVPEKTTWLQLVNPTSDLAGVGNLQAVYGSDYLSQLRDWTVSNYLDDALGVATPTAFKQPSWNTRSIETYVNGQNHANGTTFPLKTTAILSAPTTISLADGGAAYLRFGVAAGQIGGATVSTGSALPTTFSITVVRTK